MCPPTIFNVFSNLKSKLKQIEAENYDLNCINEEWKHNLFSTSKLVAAENIIIEGYSP
jgi:hypothetical protein